MKLQTALGILTEFMDMVMDKSVHVVGQQIEEYIYTEEGVYVIDQCSEYNYSALSVLLWA